MIPVEQQVLAEYDEHGDPQRHGDCMRAAVASLFELPLADVPHFVAEKNWWGAWTDWLKRRNLRVANAFLSVDPDDPTKIDGWPGDVYWLATVKSPRIKIRCRTCNGSGLTGQTWSEGGAFVTHDPPVPCPYCEGGLAPGLHMVVMLGREIVWDPHPARDDGHLGFTGGYEFRIIDPARPTR